MTIETSETTSVVDAIPDCDICQRMWGVSKPAAYDAACPSLAGVWAYMCDGCFPKWSAGKLGLGLGQRLVLAEAVA